MSPEELKLWIIGFLIVEHLIGMYLRIDQFLLTLKNVSPPTEFVDLYTRSDWATSRDKQLKFDLIMMIVETISTLCLILIIWFEFPTTVYEWYEYYCTFLALKHPSLIVLHSVAGEAFTWNDVLMKLYFAALVVLIIKILSLPLKMYVSSDCVRVRNVVANLIQQYVSCLLKWSLALVLTNFLSESLVDSLQAYFFQELIYETYSTKRLITDCNRRPLSKHTKAIGSSLYSRIQALALSLEFPLSKLHVVDSRKYDIVFIDEMSLFGDNAIYISSRFFEPFSKFTDCEVITLLSHEMIQWKPSLGSYWWLKSTLKLLDPIKSIIFYFLVELAGSDLVRKSVGFKPNKPWWPVMVLIQIIWRRVWRKFEATYTNLTKQVRNLESETILSTKLNKHWSQRTKNVVQKLFKRNKWFPLFSPLYIYLFHDHPVLETRLKATSMTT